MMKKIRCFFGFHKWKFRFCDSNYKNEEKTQYYFCFYCLKLKTKPIGLN